MKPLSTTVPLDAESVRRLVMEVLRRLDMPTQSRAHSSAAVAEPTPVVQVPPTATAISLPAAVISLGVLEKLPPGIVRVGVSATAVITPSAREFARDRGLLIERIAAGTIGAAGRAVLIAHVDGPTAAPAAAAIARAVPGGTRLAASGLADVVATIALQASRDAARGILLTSRPHVAVVVANRTASLRAVTGKAAAEISAAAAAIAANLLVLDPTLFSPSALARIAAEFAGRPAAIPPPELAQASAGCGCKGH
jgi:hypothetical protein